MEVWGVGNANNNGLFDLFSYPCFKFITILAARLFSYLSLFIHSEYQMEGTRGSLFCALEKLDATSNCDPESCLKT